jgi:plastocyanin
MKRQVVTWIAAALVIVAGLYYFLYVYPGNSSTAPATYVPPVPDIRIINFTFVPENYTIQKGETVIWMNLDYGPHQIMSDSGNEISSSVLHRAEVYSHTFKTAGRYSYHCAIHPSMKGKIIVE